MILLLLALSCSISLTNFTGGCTLLIVLATERIMMMLLVLVVPTRCFLTSHPMLHAHPLLRAQRPSIVRARTPLALARKASTPPPPPPETFSELGLTSAALQETLEAMDCVKPMEAQVLSWPSLRDSDKDVALISEAGSGKTLAYLVPLIDRLLSSSANGPFRHVLYVVVPTQDLAAQAMNVATDLCTALSLTFAYADDLSKARKADIVVGTPGSALALLTSGSGSKRSEKGGRGGSSKGGRGRDNQRRPKNAGRGARREPRPAASASASAAVTASAPRPEALTIVMDEADFLLAGVRVRGGKANASPAAKLLDELRRRGNKAGRAPSQTATAESDDDADGAPARPATAPAPTPRVVCVSATVPGQGAASVGAYLDARFPALKWVRSAGAHRPVASLTSDFETVADQRAREAALLRLCAAREGRTVVFANSASRAEEAHRLLATAGGLTSGSTLFVFHPNVPPATRGTSLERFSRTRDGVLVCSGLAARGIDLPDVALVIEYQTAPNLVEHVHRVRSSRVPRPSTTPQHIAMSY